MAVKVAVFQNLLFSLFLRILLLLYSIVHDHISTVKYTDVDYYVFNDGATYVSKRIRKCLTLNTTVLIADAMRIRKCLTLNTTVLIADAMGGSPYERDTFRYTPLLSWLLLPNVYLHELWGKLLFSLCDILAGWLIYQLVKNGKSDNPTALFCTQIWLYNPLTLTISSRGNAESIMAVFVLMTLYSISSESRKLRYFGFVTFGLAVHTKIYPVTYSLPIYLFLEKYNRDNLFTNKALSLAYKYFWPNFERIVLLVVFGVVIFGTTSIFYTMYGQEFIQETYLYHLTRTDIRHNFSVYFYMLYLTAEASYTKFLGLTLFIPQATLLLFVSFKYYKQLPFCCFLNTFIFVTFNKVCTSQYFLWYICLLPVILPKLQLSMKELCVGVALWFTGQALWLYPAYLLEFEGQATFLWIWFSGLIFYSINIFILYTMILRYDPARQKTLNPLTLSLKPKVS